MPRLEYDMNDVPEESTAPRTSWRIALLVAIVALVVWYFAQPSSGSLLDPDAQPRSVDARGDLAEDERQTIAHFESAAPSVVSVQNRAVRIDPTGGPNPYMIQEGMGTGFIWDQEGHVVTNYHVIHGSRELEVWLANHDQYPARVVGHELEKDIAVLKIEAPREVLR